MSVFALRDINMTKIESRPLRSSPILYEMENGRRAYNYVFFIDFVGSTAEVCGSKQGGQGGTPTCLHLCFTTCSSDTNEFSVPSHQSR